MKVLDLFSGKGGASQAFVDRGHDVTRYDNKKMFRDVPFTIIKDVAELVGSDLEGVDIVLAGFPCNCFTILCNHLTWPKGIPREETQKMILFVRWIHDWLEQSSVRYYVIENPKGMMRSSNVLGKPDVTLTWAAYHNDSKQPLKPTDLWGRLPPFERKLPFKWEKAPRGSRTGVQRTDFKPENRALWPYEFSLALCIAAEGSSPQQTLDV